MTTMPRDFHSPLPSCRECCWVSFILITFTAGCTSSRQTELSSNPPPAIQAMRMPFIIGDTNVYALVYQHGLPSPTFINVHDDENTSVEAGKAVIDQTSGRLIELAHSGRRHLRFSV